jgi:hypothetical protein
MNPDPIEPSLDVSPTKEALDSLYRQTILQARKMSPEEKFLAGPRLFDYACRVTLDGIRNQFPGIDDQRAGQILKQRLAWQRHREAQRSSGERPRES